MALPELLQTLKKDSLHFIKVELTRLGQEVKFINEINSTIDFMVGSMVDKMMEKIEPSIIQNTNLPEDNTVVRSLVTNALYKALDNKMVTGTSDMVNRRPGELFSQITGDSETANLISSISNRAGDGMPSSLPSVGRGSFREADDISEDIYDIINRLYTKIFNIIGMLIPEEPSMVAVFAKMALDIFVRASDKIAASISRFDELSIIVRDDCAALDASYYLVDHMEVARLAQGHLESADLKLVNVRARIINSNVVDEYRYGLAKDDIQNAIDVLADNGGPANRVQEIMGALDEMEVILVQLEGDYTSLEDSLGHLQVYMDEFGANYDSTGTVLGVMTNIQSEIRSTINSMDIAISRGQISIMHENNRRWWLQLIAIIEEMGLLPGSVQDYFATDPDGYIDNYNVVVAFPLQALSLPDIGILRGQFDQLKYWVSRRLASDVPMTQINDIVSQMGADNLTRTNEMASATAIANSYDAPISETASQVPALLGDVGMDRAQDLFNAGNWSEFFFLSPQNSTYLGQLESSVGESIEAASQSSTVTVDGLAAMNEVLMFVRDKKRARDTLASTFTTTKSLGLDFKVNFEIPTVQRIFAFIDRFVTEVSGV